jgi:hypothetical protein
LIERDRRRLVVPAVLLFTLHVSLFASYAAEAPRHEIQRIVSLAPSVTETVFALGRGDALVGVSAYCDYPPGYPLAGFPAGFHRDPADRVIVATARVLGATLLTADRRIVASGFVPTLS